MTHPIRNQLQKKAAPGWGAAFGLFQEFGCLSALADDVKALVQLPDFGGGHRLFEELSVSGVYVAGSVVGNDAVYCIRDIEAACGFDIRPSYRADMECGATLPYHRHETVLVYCGDCLIVGPPFEFGISGFGRKDGSNELVSVAYFKRKFFGIESDGLHLNYFRLYRYYAGRGLAICGAYSDGGSAGLEGLHLAVR